MVKKLNNKGFAISTILYGLLVVIMLITSLLMSTMAFSRKNSKEFTDNVRDELEKKFYNIPESFKRWEEASRYGNVCSYTLVMDNTIEYMNARDGGSINNNQISMPPGAWQYGPYDKTITPGTYRVEYVFDSLPSAIYSVPTRLDSYYHNIPNSGLAFWAAELDTITYGIRFVSFSGNRFIYDTDISNVPTHKGVEFSFKNNTSFSLIIKKISITKLN